MARVAMFLARSPGPPMTGRKAVINTAIEALARDGHEVNLFIVAEPGSAPHWASAATWLGAVPKTRVLWNAVVAAVGGERSLNEALFYSPRLLRMARDLRGAYDFAFADTLRMAPYASALGVPWHLDLDDLFSRRYERFLSTPGELSASLVLGYARDSVPAPARALPPGVLRQVLARESARLARREVYWARRATTVSLVSPQEAEDFSRIAARPVLSLPMSVPIPASPWRPGGPQPAQPAFLGGLDYKPNFDALLYYQQSIFPLLKALPGAPLLSHIGNAPAELRRKFRPDAVRFEGYVADVASRLASAGSFLAPIVGGTGVKTKVLEAMALGLPVLATPQALTGLRVEHGEHCFICERPPAFTDGMRFVRDAGAAQRMGMRAREYVRRHFSLDVLRARWREVLAELARARGSRCSS